MSKSATRKNEKHRPPSEAQARSRITHPVLLDAFDVDWYYPWQIPEEAKKEKCVRDAIREGWAEWIESPEDLEAVRAGYKFDLSRDTDGNPIYWYKGQWHRYKTSTIAGRKHRRLVAINGPEEDFVAYCGAGDHFCRFAESVMTHTKGEIAGQPYRFMAWQRKLCMTLFGWVIITVSKSTGKAIKHRRFREAMIEIPKKNAKLLSDDTQIPTPSGWKLHGDLVVGDELFDARGDVCQVVAVHPKGEATHEVVFTNGERLKASLEHRWVTERLDDRKYTHGVRETREILSTLKTGDGSKRHRVTQQDGSHVHIAEVNELPRPVTGNCITVSSADGTYLAGKSMLPTHNSDMASIITVYLVRADYTEKAYVYGCASDRKQAGIVYKEAKNYVEASEFLKDELTIIDSKQKIVHMESGSYYEVVSADAYRNDGYDALGVIFDELHRQPNRKLFTVMKRSGRARPGKHLRVVITTYGETTKGIWGEEHQKAKNQLAGRKSNTRRLVMIASAEPITVTTTTSVDAGSTWIPVWRLEQPISAGEVLEFDSTTGGKVVVTLTARAKRFQPFIECEPLDRQLPEFSEAEANKEWRSDDAIRRANPSVDIVFPIEDIREDIADSVGPEAEAEAKQLSLNILSGGGRRWISSAVWQACGRHRVLMSSLLGKRCYGAGDFSFSTDLTAFWLAFPNWPHSTKFAKVDSPLVSLVGLVWVPEDGIEEREESEEIPYRAYAEMPYIGDFGPVRLCEGSVIDYAQVGREIVEVCRRFKVQAVAYDPAYSQFVIDPHLTPAGIRCIPHRQGLLSMAPPTKRFEELLKRRAIAHGNHPLLDEAMMGALLKKGDAAGNRSPCKDKSTSRIDALIAAIMATGWACDPPQELKGSGAWSGKGTGLYGDV